MRRWALGRSPLWSRACPTSCARCSTRSSARAGPARSAHRACPRGGAGRRVERPRRSRYGNLGSLAVGRERERAEAETEGTEYRCGWSRAMLAGRLWMTTVVKLELLYSTRDLEEFAQLERRLDDMREARNQIPHVGQRMPAIETETTAGAGGVRRVAPCSSPLQHSRSCIARRFGAVTQETPGSRCSTRLPDSAPSVPGR